MAAHPENVIRFLQTESQESPQPAQDACGQNTAGHPSTKDFQIPTHITQSKVFTKGAGRAGTIQEHKMSARVEQSLFG
jgi:hypothetical protein